MRDTNGQVVAGGNGQGNQLDQLYQPADVLIDKETDSLIICDRGNRRVVRWSRRSGTIQGEILIDNIACRGLAMDNQRYLYISDVERYEVRRYQIGDKNGTIVAGGNGGGAGLNQLNVPTYIFVDQQQAVYVSDRDNHRVMKWNKGAKEGIVVGGGQEEQAAIYSFVAQIDDREIVAQLKERKEAQQEYSDALRQGHGAYLLEQEEKSQDNFIISVGALPP
ncbi:unnamed protein product, partial [Rotaria sordida]